MTIQPDIDIGRYYILEQLGEGGMAVVYKAYDTRLDCNMAVKFIRTESLTAKEAEKTLKRFEIEAQKMAQLSHTNIVKVTDYGKYKGIPYLVMPYLEGGTLKKRLGKPMPCKVAARILLPIAQALAHTHQEGIIHRDVKPSNILFTKSSQPMLSDFGIAKIFKSEATIDLTGKTVGVGTPEYMAPEQVSSQSFDQRVDIYSLGIVFYEMVTGRKPFQADTPIAVIVKQINDPLPRPKKLIPNLPGGVERVLFKALAKKPENRFQDMDAFAEVLEKIAQGQTEPLGKLHFFSIETIKRSSLLRGISIALLAIISLALLWGVYNLVNDRVEGSTQTAAQPALTSTYLATVEATQILQTTQTSEPRILLIHSDDKETVMLGEPVLVRLTGWIATTEELAEQGSDVFDIHLFINGDPIGDINQYRRPAERIYYEDEDEYTWAVYWDYLIDTSTEGVYYFWMEYSLTSEVFDGWDTYEPGIVGERQFFIHVEASGTEEDASTLEETAVEPTAAKDIISLLPDFLADAKIIYTEEFNDPFLGGWDRWGNAYVKDGSLFIAGDSGWPAAVRTSFIHEGEALLILFRYSEQTEFAITMNSGEYNTPEYRYWGMKSDTGRTFITDLTKGDQWIGGQLISGNLFPRYDHWYLALLQVVGPSDLKVRVWDAGDASKYLEELLVMDSDWEYRGWRGSLTAASGLLEVDTYIELQIQE